MNHPRMTSSGRRNALLVAILIALALPKRVERAAVVVGREQCTPYEIEPWVFYGLERVFHRNVGFAYSSGEDCR